MIAIDTSTAVLAVAILTLCVTTAVTSLALPSFSFTRRRRARETPPDRPARRVVTGRPARLPEYPAMTSPAIELGPAPRPVRTPTDGRVGVEHVGDAVALIEQLLDEHPERLAELISLWVNEDS